MIPEVTREEHYYALRDKADAIGYCLNLFYDKTKSKHEKNFVLDKLRMWLRIIGLKQRPPQQIDLLTGCEHIKNFFSKKFA